MAVCLLRTGRFDVDLVIPSEVWVASHDGESTVDRLVEHWAQIVRGEYLEIPGLLLTRTQVQHLWGLDSVTSDGVLEALLAARFLQRTDTGAFVRVDEGSR